MVKVGKVIGIDTKNAKLIVVVSETGDIAPYRTARKGYFHHPHFVYSFPEATESFGKLFLGLFRVSSGASDSFIRVRRVNLMVLSPEGVDLG
jgi:hypothetical protein